MKNLTPENVRSLAELALGMSTEDALTFGRSIQANFVAAGILVGLGEHMLSKVLDSLDILVDMTKVPPTTPPTPASIVPATTPVVVETVTESNPGKSKPKNTKKATGDRKVFRSTIKDKLMETIFLRGDLGATRDSLFKLGFRSQTVELYLKDMEFRGFITRGKYKGRVYYWANRQEETPPNNIGFAEATRLFTSKLRPFTREELKKHVPAERVGQYLNVWEQRGLITLSPPRTVATPTPKACQDRVMEAIREFTAKGENPSFTRLKNATRAEAGVLDATLKYLDSKNLCQYTD